jgi:hypothetical protein
MLSYLSYSCAYELEYSHVIIMIYELVYSLYAMILTCSSSFFNVLMICMSRSRVRLGWRFVVPSGLPISFTSFTYWSVGLRTREVYVVSLYTGVVLGYMGTYGYDDAPRLRGRRQVVTALSVPCNPPRLDIRIGVHKVSMAWQTRPGDPPVHLKLSPNSSHITCMIINCSLHGYIRTCRLHVGIFFYSLFSFYPWGWPRCVFNILVISILPLS